MKKSDRTKRMIAFYFSVALFFITLPILLSYSLGYHIDYNAFRVYKTGIIYVKSTPAGGSVYINGKLHTDITPTQIEELKPGMYRIEVRREGFYPWERELSVKPNMVTKADRIVLFPVRQEIKTIGAYETEDFAVSDKNYIYYMTKNGLFRSSIDGTVMRKISGYSDWPNRTTIKKFSPDGSKFFYFTERNVWVVYLSPDKALTPPAAAQDTARVEEVAFSADAIRDVFWYSGSDYIIVVTDRDIKVVELRGAEKRNIVPLYKFNRRPQGIFYDDNTDSLYFTDIKKEAQKSYLHRLDLRQTFFGVLRQLIMGSQPQEQE